MEISDNRLNNDRYRGINQMFGFNGIDLFNHGFYPPYKKFKNENIFLLNQLSLYMNMIKGIKTKNKTILDVGCGRGGGIAMLSKYKKFLNVYACDINLQNIGYADRFNSNNVKFDICSAENLLYPDNSFDILINVESAHAYSDKLAFLNESRRVLKSNGVAIISDCDMEIFDIIDSSKTFSKIKRYDITKNVIDACVSDLTLYKKEMPEGDVKNFLLDTILEKYNNYTYNNVKYLKYVCR